MLNSKRRNIQLTVLNTTKSIICNGCIYITVQVTWLSNLDPCFQCKSQNISTFFKSAEVKWSHNDYSTDL